MTGPLILDGLQMAFGGLPVLRGVYLEVPPGGICGLVGRNGCGKTTALRIAAGQLRPDSGIVTIGDERFHKPSLRRRFARLAYLPQISMLPPETRAGRFAALGGFPLDADLARQRVRQMSTGERRLLELRLVLALGREFCLLDEPFTGLAPIHIDRMTELLRRAADAGTGILITDHYHQYVTPLADTAYLMESGQCRRVPAPIGESLTQMGYLPT